MNLRSLITLSRRGILTWHPSLRRMLKHLPMLSLLVINCFIIATVVQYHHHDCDGSVVVADTHPHHCHECHSEECVIQLAFFDLNDHLIHNPSVMKDVAFLASYTYFQSHNSYNIGFIPLLQPSILQLVSLEGRVLRGPPYC
ncbi:MAG: hypothetical protein LIO90_10045 [Bacteroidales bacterium]|nr:hypothetical protein [Bacteroidales bacterium]